MLRENIRYEESSLGSSFQNYGALVFPMDVPANPLPLLRLPRGALKRILLTWEVGYLFALSILSIKALQLVKSLKIRSTSFSVQVSSIISIFSDDLFRSIELRFYLEDRLTYVAASRTPPGQVSAEFPRYKSAMWTRPNYSMKDWIELFMSVLNRPKIGKLSFDGGGRRFYLDSLKEVIGGVEKLDIAESCSDVDALRITRTFQLPDQIRLYRRFDGMEQILIRNLEVFTLSQRWGLLQLNELLVCNAKRVQYLKCRISDRDLNRFLKLWISGSNPKLQNLKLGVQHRDTREVLRGIETREISEENRRRLPPRHQRLVRNVAEMDLQRKDGMMASLVFVTELIHIEVNFFVWH